MIEKWTGKIERPLRIYTNPRITDDIYLHFYEILDKIKMFADKIKGRVLDIGAGNAPYRKFFRKARDYLRLDKYSYENTDINADVTKKLPIGDNSFDSVVCIQLLEHVNKPQKVINEIYRVLKDDGVCLLTTHMAAPLHGEPYDYYRFTKYGLKDLFKKFKSVEVVPNGGAALSIFQLIVWGVSEKLPKFAAAPLIIFLNMLGRISDKAFYSEVFTINYSVFAVK